MGLSSHQSAKMKIERLQELLSRASMAHSITFFKIGMDEYREILKDAMRYVWLRDEAKSCVSAAPLVFMADRVGHPGCVINGDTLDRSIDQVIRDT